MNEQARLESARDWIKSYQGKSIISGYAKWFGVDKICAINELRKMDVSIPVEIENEIRESIKSQIEFKARRKKEKEIESYGEIESYENFTFIAGHTSAGAPYGLTNSETKSD